MGELMTINKENALEVFTGEKLEKYLDDIATKYKNFVGDTSTAVGRKQIASKAYEVAKEKTQIDSIRKALVEDWKKKAKLVDASGKVARDFLDNLKAEVRQPLTVWEKEEEDRKQKERNLAKLEIEWDEAIAENSLFDRQKAVEKKEAELKAAEDALAEKERAELAEREEKDRAEREEKERVEREKRIAEEARIKAENDAKEQIEAAERAKIEAELKAKANAERAEREKVEAIELAKKEEAARIKKEEDDRKRAEEEVKRIAEKKAANIAHQRKINKDALKCFVENGIDEEKAKAIISLIAKNKISHITIKY